MFNGTSWQLLMIYRLKEKKPGDLTDDLRTALGMPVGPNAHKVISFGSNG